jgi:uncharacterized protein (TIRG00374 family)
MMKVNKKMLAFFALGIFIIYILLEFLGLQKIIATLSTVNPFILLLAFIVHLATIGVLVLRIRSIAGPEVGLVKYTKTTFAGLFVNFITPIMKVGGEPVKIYMLKKNLGGSKASAAVAMDTFVEILSSYITFFIIFVMFFFLIPGELLFYYVIFLVVTFVATVVFLKLSLTPQWLTKVVNFFIRKTSRFLKIEKKDYGLMFHDSFVMLLKNKKVMLSSLGFSLFGKILEFVRIWVVFLALGVNLPWTVVVVVWGFLLILLLIPWLPGGLGLIEAGTIAAFAFMGIDLHVAATAVVLDRIVWFWLILFIGFALTTKYTAEMKNELQKSYKATDTK